MRPDSEPRKCTDVKLVDTCFRFRGWSYSTANPHPKPTACTLQASSSNNVLVDGPEVILRSLMARVDKVCFSMKVLKGGSGPEEVQKMSRGFTGGNGAFLPEAGGLYLEGMCSEPKCCQRFPPAQALDPAHKPCKYIDETASLGIPEGAHKICTGLRLTRKVRKKSTYQRGGRG